MEAGPKFCTQFLVEHYRMVVAELIEDNRAFASCIARADLAAMCDYMEELEKLQEKYKLQSETYDKLAKEHLELGATCIRLQTEYEVLKKNFL